MKVFISYPDKDRRFARKVKAVLVKLGHECFLAADEPHQLAAGLEGWIDGLMEKTDSSDAFVLCLTPASPAADMQRREWRYACLRSTLQKVVVHEGEWVSAYEKAFAYVRTLQCFRIDDKASLAAFRRILPIHPPEKERFAFMERVVIEAGTQLMLRFGAQMVYGTPQAVDERRNPAINVDLDIQQQIISEIRRHFPKDGILAEESFKMSKIPEDTELIWTVDPLDGTLNFMSGDDRFCCGLGLLQGGKPLMGAIFVPSRMVLYTGGLGRKAQCFSLADSTVKVLSTDRSVEDMDRCRVLTHINAEAQLIDVCFEDDFPRKLHEAVRRVWMWGCGLLSILGVAKGTHHVYVQRVTYPHDIVPGLAILESAGGVWATIPQGRKLSWDPAQERIGIVAACSQEILDTFLSEFPFLRS